MLYSTAQDGACKLLIPSWVSIKDSSLPEGGGEISIEKLETQLNTLKTMFAEKQKLVNDLEAYGPAGKKIKGRIEQTCFNWRLKDLRKFLLPILSLG